MNKDDDAYIQECLLFHELVRKRRRADITDVYIALQAALAYSVDLVNVGNLIGQLMPPGRRTTDSYCAPLGHEGLAYLSMLFDIELVEKGGTDYHHYRFTRKHDGVSVVAYVKTALNPDGVQFVFDYKASVKKVLGLRNKLIENSAAVRQPI